MIAVEAEGAVTPEGGMPTYCLFKILLKTVWK